MASVTAQPQQTAIIQTPFAWRVALALIILIEIAFGVFYAIRTPLWQAPDEPAHFNYVRHIAETGTLPMLRPGDYNQDYLEQIKAAKFPPTMSIDSIRYEMYQPPLYYLAAAPIYLVARAIGLNTVLALRLLSVLIGAGVLLLASILFKQIFPQNRLLALAAVGLMATIPMNVAMWADVNADPLADLLIAILLLVSLARILGTATDRVFIVAGGIIYGLVLLTSIKIYPAGLVLVLAEVGNWKLDGKRWRTRVRQQIGPGLRILAPLFAISLFLSGWWFIRNMLVYGGLDIMGLGQHDRVVIGQPTTAEWIAQYGFKNIFADFFIITFKSFWAQFGWMGVLVNDRIYVALFLLTGVALFGALLWLIRLARAHWAEVRGVGWNWLTLGTWLAITLLAHIWYNIHYVQPQGRYLFPALIPIAALLVVGLYELIDKRYARLVLGLLYIVLIGLDYLSLFWYIIPQLRI